MKINDVFDRFTSKAYSAAILSKIFHLYQHFLFPLNFQNEPPEGGCVNTASQIPANICIFIRHVILFLNIQMKLSFILLLSATCHVETCNFLTTSKIAVVISKLSEALQRHALIRFTVKVAQSF